MINDLSVLTVLWYITEWLMRLLALFVVPRNRKPTAGMAWLLVIFLVPPLGWLLFLAIGNSKLPKARRNAQRTLDRYIVRAIDQVLEKWQDARALIDASVPEKYRSSALLARNLTHLPVFDGNKVEPLTNYDDSIEQLVKDAQTAQKFIHIEYYTLALDKTTKPLIETLIEAAARGVVVRVLYDSYGSRKYPDHKKMIELLKNGGVQVHAMLPIRWFSRHYTRPDLRNHRKLAVIDGFVAYTGSQNMIARNYHRKDQIIYDEMVVRLSGPIVLQIETVFLNDWHAETGEFLHESIQRAHTQLASQGTVKAHIVPSGPGYEYENNLKVFTSLFYSAQKSIVIVNPYFVPPESLIMALTNAAQRGVEVKLVNSQAIDQALVANAQRSYYEQLLKAGIKIYLYKKPNLLHAKYIIIDEEVVAVGSSNMDVRSFELNQELTLIAYDQKLTRQMIKITDDYLGHSQRLSSAEWARRSQTKKLLNNLARLTSSLQ